MMRLIAPRPLEVAITARTVRIRVGVSYAARRLVAAEVAAPAVDGAIVDAIAGTKVRGEFLVLGSAYGDLSRVDCSVQVGALEKTVAVFGERVWGATSPSAAAPVGRLELGWSRAFGGRDFPLNPVGIGLEAVDGVVPLPQIESPTQLIRARGDRPRPAGFGPLPERHPARVARLGTYDSRWLEEQWPGLPLDFDPLYFNCASEDQWLPAQSYWRGDEAIRCVGLHRDKAVSEGRLPGLRARCLVALEARVETVTEVALALDTLVLQPDQEQVLLTFRGQFASSDDEADALRAMMCLVDDSREMRIVERLADVLVRRMDRKVGARASDEELLPSWGRGTSHGFDVGLWSLAAKEGLSASNARRRATNQLEATRARLTAHGLDTSFLPAEIPPPRTDATEEELEALEVDAKAQGELLRARARQEIRAAVDRARAEVAAHGVELAFDPDETPRVAGGPPKFDPFDALERLGQTGEMLRNAGVPDDENEPLRRARDPRLRHRLGEAKAALIDVYRAHVQFLPPAATLDADEGYEARARVVSRLRAGESFAAEDLTSIDLSRLDLAQRDFRAALLERADLHGADLRRTDFRRAVLARADLGDARTDGILLAGANLSEARMGGAVLAGVDLRRATLLRADLRKCDLRGANLDGAALSEVQASGADLSGASAQKALFMGADLEFVRFRGADLRGAVFQELDLSTLDFSDACLEKAEFIDCTGGGANFKGANLSNARFAWIKTRSSFEGADFTGANLSEANLRDLDLRRARFAGADLRGADLSRSSCEGADLQRVAGQAARLAKTKLRGARLRGANLREATLDGADLSSADLTAANLFSASLLFTMVDGATRIEGAELAQAAFKSRSGLG